jgi:hypothetical protein
MASAKCAILSAQSQNDLEKKVNKWLEEHYLFSPDRIKFQYHSIYLDDPVEHIVEHTIVIFYPTGSRGE